MAEQALAPSSVSNGELSPAEQIKRGIRLLATATVVLFIALSAVVYWSVTTSAKTKDALCTYRQQQVDQVRLSKDYLIEHPKGAPGIPKKLIVDGIQRSEQIVKALDSLGC